MAERLYLGRHGQSEGNVIEEACRSKDLETKKYQDIDWDADDWPLTNVGHEQSRLTGDFLLAQGLSDNNCDIWTSPMRRAQQTARHFGFTAAAQIVLPLYERKTVNISYMDIRQAIRDAPSDRTAREIAMRGTFGGRVEPFEAMLERIAPVAERAMALETENLVVVSHGHVMMGLRTLIEDMNEDQITDILRGDTSMSAIKKRPTMNGDVIVYSRDVFTGQYGTRQHFGPSDNYAGDIVQLTEVQR